MEKMRKTIKGIKWLSLNKKYDKKLKTEIKVVSRF